MMMLNTFEKTTTKGLDIIEYYEKLCSRVNEIEVPSFSDHNDCQVYQEGNISNDPLKDIIGVVKEISSVPHVIGKTPPFLHKEVRAHTIQPVSNDKAWITYEGEKEFAFMDRNGKCFRSVKKTTFGHSFFVTKDDAFVTLDFDKKIVLKYDYAGKTSVIMKTASLRPFFVGDALDGNILVTLVDELSYSRSSQSQRKVQMVTPVGQVLHTYEFAEDRSTPVLTRPARPTQNYNSNVCILDFYEAGEDQFRSKVFIFYETGELKFVYKGGDGEFNPHDVCCDSLCNIICTNYRDNSVHIIDSDGTFLAYLLTSDTCIPDPLSLGLYGDALWVGSNTGEVAVYSYKY